MRIAIVLASVLLANSAMSQESIFDRLDKFYLGAGVNFLELTGSENASGSDANFATIEILGGYKYNGFISGEARIGVGTSGETLTAELGGDAGQVQAEVDIEYTGSLYWRPETANEIAKIYGLLGFSTVSIKDGDSESGISYGGGVGFTFQEDWNLNFEYRSIIDKDAFEFTALSANVDYRF